MVDRSIPHILGGWLMGRRVYMYRFLNLIVERRERL